MEIVYLTNKEIDKQKWDFCIKNSINSSIEAYSWYLDIACEGWDALVQNDYMRVMPLPRTKKYSFHIIKTPSLVNNLGIFSIGKLSPEITEEFLSRVPRKFLYFELALNRYNKVSTSEYSVTRTFGYAMDLIKPYPKIHEEFKNSFHEKLSIAENNKLSVRRKLSIYEYQQFFKYCYTENKISFQEKEFERLRRLYLFMNKHGLLEIIGVYSRNNTLICTCCIVSYQNMVVIHRMDSLNEYKNLHANTLILDECIREMAGRNLVMDFAGINNDDYSTVLREISAHMTEYLTIKRNKLPWPMKNI